VCVLVTNFVLHLTGIIRNNYQQLLSYIALRVDSIPVDDDDPNDMAVVGNDAPIPAESDKCTDLAASPMELDEQALVAPDNDLTMPPTDNNNCQCRYLFCDNCLPSHLLLKGCWYEERTPEEQQQEIAHEVERRRQQGINKAVPLHPVVRVRYHPDGTKLVLRSRGKCFTYLTWSTHNFVTVIKTHL
jgi:hypothetical protein